MTRIGIIALSSYLPGPSVGNSAVAEATGADTDWMEERIGIRSRHYAQPQETTQDLATEAAHRLLRETPTRPDLIVLATVTPDQPVPATACLVQNRLALTGVPAVDVNGACSGFVYALAYAYGLTLAGLSRNPLVIGADIFTRHVDPSDRRTAPLFGDGAGAVLLGPVPNGYGILGMELWAEGSQANYATVPPAGNGLFSMNGRGVSEVVLEMGPKVLDTALARAGVRIEQLERVIVHQANPSLVHKLAEQVGLDDTVVPALGSRTGNTASASIPLTLALTHQEKPLRHGDLVAFVAVGAGMTAGAAVIRWYEEG
ncbi:ketoacyl-ACP synthase III [Streptomyces sp. G44]|nr:ketoacyl-ACP synthase III [Streptomyces sp. G44]